MHNFPNSRQIILQRHSPEYWRVTFDLPPLNIFGPETIPQLNEIITDIETDERVTVVVFDSAVEGFFLTHYNFLAKTEDSASLPPGSTGLQPARIKKLFEHGFHQPGDVENRLGYYVGELGK
jgi:enoyl-CoA hydratase/carnithine racemase